MYPQEESYGCAMKNCLTFAIKEWKPFLRNSWFAFRRSLHGAFPHFAIYTQHDEETIIRREYVPINPIKRILPPLFFEGKIVTTTFIKQTEEVTEWS